MQNVVSEILLSGYLYLLFGKSSFHFILSFTLSHLHKSSPTLMQENERYTWYLLVLHMSKMTRDEPVFGFGFKSCRIHGGREGGKGGLALPGF